MSEINQGSTPSPFDFKKRCESNACVEWAPGAQDEKPGFYIRRAVAGQQIGELIFFPKENWLAFDAAAQNGEFGPAVS